MSLPIELTTLIIYDTIGTGINDLLTKDDSNFEQRSWPRDMFVTLAATSRVFRAITKGTASSLFRVDINAPE